MICVIVIDDHALVRRSLRDALEDFPDIQIVGEASNGQEGLELFHRCACDVVVLDISLPDISGIDVLKKLVAEGSPARVVMFSMYPETPFAVRTLRMGALAYVTKGAPVKELVAAIRRAAKGRLRPQESGEPRG
jgi:two-component system invasion response regulator UvrY